MWLNQVSNPGPLAHESDALLTALCGPTMKEIWSHLSYDVLETFTLDTYIFGS